MNHIYRLIWSNHTNTWVAVAETAPSRSKGSSRSSRKALIAALIASGLGFAAEPALAGTPTSVVPTGGRTTAFTAPNGVPVVNINTPNAAGLSNNLYTTYNVQSKGLVLNNAGALAGTSSLSQLAGQVPVNTNLVLPAKIILNQVVSTNPSTLAGFTEVLGGNADVIVANPNGITCNGCGFINTNHATLTTGTPNIASDGSLSGFTVNQGNVTIGSLGANASAQQIFDIVARSVTVNGVINVGTTGSLGITTGNNVWNYASRSVTGSVAGSGAAPTYSIDSTVLGGMYAGRISIIATEAGVGVRMLSNAAASADDFTLSSAGAIEIQSAISAQRNASITTTSSTGNQDIYLNGTSAEISAANNLALSATNGQIALSEGKLYAANNVTLTGATLSDVSTTGATRFAGVNNTITTTGAASINGGVWGAGSALTGTFDNLSIGANGATIYAGTTLGLSGTNGLSLGTAGIKSAGDMTLAASTGGISTAAGASQGIETTAGNLNLTTGSGFINAGMIRADAGNITGTINGTLTNSGTILADAGSITGAINGALTNSGALHSGGDMTLNAPTVNNTNTGGISSNTTLTVNATTGNLDNYGALYAGQTLNANAWGTFTNYVGGTMDSGGDINVDTVAPYFNNPGTFINNNTVNAGGNIDIAATYFHNDVSGDLTRVWTQPSYGPISPRSNVGMNLVVMDGSTPSTSCYGPTGLKLACPQSLDQYSQTWSRQQYFANLNTSTIFKPQIIAGGTTTIQNFQTGTNMGGVISGASVNLTTTRGGATFTNDDLTLASESGTKDWEVSTYWAGVIWHALQYYIGNAPTDVIFCYRCGMAGPSDAHGDPVITTTPGGATLTGVQGGTGFWSAPSQTFGPTQGVTVTSTTYSGSVGAGIFANGGGLSTSGFALTNNGSTSVGAPKTASPTNNTSFNGVTITLPTNPNGYFVLDTSPSAQYIVETNPLYDVVSNFVPANYMETQYGYNPDTIIKLVGDASYQNYLIQQQMIAQTGNNLLKDYSSQAAMMQGLMDNGVTEAKSMGLTFGVAPTPDQIANLKTDMVWMVEKVVDGQKAFVPVVYLAPGTRNAIVTGAVIAGQKVNMNLTSLANKGGTISGSKSLKIISKGDITNTGGTITGGDVAIKSTEGSIRNETLVNGNTTGKTASISSTGNLNLDAKKDITVLGGKVKAGGDASLSAGRNVTFDTIVTKETTYSTSHSDDGLQSTNGSSITTTEKNIGSSLASGGNLKIKSGGDTTIAGSAVAAGKGLDVNTGGSFNVLARQDKTITNSQSTTTGLGVGGGLFGTQTTTTNSFTGKNFGSTIKVGGDAKIKSGNEMTVQGSNLSVKGNADINARKGIKILDGLDVKRTTTQTTTQTFLKADGSGAGSSDASANSAANASLKGANAVAGANANAGGSGEGNFKLSETTVATTDSGSNKSIASNFTVGGNLKMKTDGTLKIQGSNVASGGNMALDAKNVEVLAGRNETYNNTKTTSVSVGLYTNADASASAGANAKAGTSGVGANADASAQGNGTATLGGRVSTDTSTAYQLNNTGSTLKSGGNLSIKAKENATFVGADVKSGGNMNIKAKNIRNMAAQDIVLNTRQKAEVTTGLYADTNVNIQASAGTSGTGASAGADASAGGHVNANMSFGSDGSVKQKTSSFTSGGNLTRTAKNTITDQGTQLNAAGDINQSARRITEVAASDSTFSKQISGTMDLKVGVGADAGASAGLGLTGPSGGANAGVGFRAKVSGEIDTSTQGSTTAVTSSYKAGGNINSKSKEATTLIGTQFQSGGNTNIQAGTLNYQAAKNTTTSTSSTSQANGALKIDVYGKAGGSLDASLSHQDNSDKTSTAVAGSINTGGKLNIKTAGDASFEGTKINSSGGTAIAAGGSVNFKAARNTSESSQNNVDASLSVSTNKGSAGVGASASFSHQDSSSSQAQVGSINGGAGGIRISAVKNATFEGTSLKTTGKTTLKAGGNVNLVAAKDTSTSTSFGAGLSLSGNVGGKSAKGEKS